MNSGRSDQQTKSREPSTTGVEGRRLWTLAIAIPFIVALLPGCGAAPEARDVVVRDSAGIRITENAVQVWTPERAWRLAGSPQVSIGTLEGLEEYQLTDVARVWRTDKGMIVVGDRTAHQIRMYDADGGFLRSFGREGEGPGEFRHLTALAPYRGDSIITWDTRLKRISVFDAQGVLGRMQRVTLDLVQRGEGQQSWGISESFVGAFDDGSLVFAPMMILRYEPEASPVFERPLVHVSAEGDFLASLGTFVVAEIRGSARPFPRVEAITIRGDRLYNGLGEQYEIQMWTAGGVLERLIRIPAYERAVDQHARNDFTEWFRERQRAMGRSEQQAERELSRTTFPTVLPPYSALLVDTRDNLWVEEYRLRTDSLPTRWDVFDPAGRWLGAVDMPRDFQAHQIGPDFVIGVRAQDGDVPLVESYPLVKSAPLH